MSTTDKGGYVQGDDICGFCLEPWADHSPTEVKSCEADLAAEEERAYREADRG